MAAGGAVISLTNLYALVDHRNFMFDAAAVLPGEGFPLGALMAARPEDVEFACHGCAADGVSSVRLRFFVAVLVVLFVLVVPFVLVVLAVCGHVLLPFVTEG